MLKSVTCDRNDSLPNYLYVSSFNKGIGWNRLYVTWPTTMTFKVSAAVER
jgi:hypothetical protein